MKYQISKGITLTSIHTDKFKNILVTINFLSAARAKNYAKLALLAEILENSTQLYPTSLKVSRKLSEMFGANFGITVLRYGDCHDFRVRISYPADRYLPNQNDLTEEIIEFLKEVIQNPLVDQGQFDQAYFDLHSRNITNYLNSIAENKEYYSMIQLQKLYYPDDVDHGSFLLGTPSELKGITAQSLYQFYQEVLKDFEISIYVAGNVDDKQFVNGFKGFSKFTDRKQLPKSFYIKPKPSVKTNSYVEKQVASQSLVNIGFEFPIYYNSADYFSAVLFNQLFGGSSRSLLFTDIREKHSLAYDIHSDFDSLSGMLSVQAGVQSGNENQVISLIDEQLNKAQKGDFSNDLVEGIKRSIINQRRAQNDYQTSLIERNFIKRITNHYYSIDQWEEAIRSVDKEMITKVSKKLAKRAVYILKSSGNKNEKD